MKTGLSKEQSMDGKEDPRTYMSKILGVEKDKFQTEKECFSLYS